MSSPTVPAPIGVPCLPSSALRAGQGVEDGPLYYCSAKPKTGATLPANDSLRQWVGEKVVPEMFSVGAEAEDRRRAGQHALPQRNNQLLDSHFLAAFSRHR